jgi:hypothetical protein
MPEPPCRSCVCPSGSLPRLGNIWEFFEDEASPEVLENLPTVREKFLRNGAEIV